MKPSRKHWPIRWSARSRLLHPFMPFVTEALWQELPHAGESVMIASWPGVESAEQACRNDFGALIDIVRAIRNARTEAGVEPRTIG